MGPGLAGRIALVTGGASGIGAATARRLAAEGALVLVSDIDSRNGAATTAAIVDAGGQATFAHLDVAIEADWRALIDRASSEFGALHVLVNSAGVSTRLNLEDETLDSWAATIAVSQTGVWLGMKFGGPLIKASGGGSIINVSSIFGTVGWEQGSVAYSAAKGAVRSMTKNAALLWAREGVRVNSVHPGFIATQMTESFRGTELERIVLRDCPMGRWGRPEDVAAGIAYLAGNDAAFVTGAELYMDGGWTAR